MPKGLGALAGGAGIANIRTEITRAGLRGGANIERAVSVARGNDLTASVGGRNAMNAINAIAQGRARVTRGGGLQSISPRTGGR